MNNKNLFKDILNWAFEKQGSGFNEQELFKKFQVDSKWYLKIFRSSQNESENLVCHLYYDDKNATHYHTLTSKGISEYYKLNKPWHEKPIGKIIFIILGAIIGLIIKEFWKLSVYYYITILTIAIDIICKIFINDLVLFLIACSAQIIMIALIIFSKKNFRQRTLIA